MTTSKIMWTSVISTPGAQYLTADAKHFYLGTPLDHAEYMRMKIELIPHIFINKYDLNTKVKDGYVYMKIIRGMWEQGS